MKRRYLRIGDWKRNALIVATASCLGMTACQNKEQPAEATGDWSSAESHTQGVITELTEVSPGDWKITNEKPAGAGQVAAIVKHLDGKVDTLQGEALKRQMNEYAAVNPSNVHRTGMMDVLMWSGIGFMAGRMLSPSPRYYANPGVMQQTSTWRNNVSRERTSRGGAYGGTTRRSAPSGRTGVFSGSRGGFSA